MLERADGVDDRRLTGRLPDGCEEKQEVKYSLTDRRLNCDYTISKYIRESSFVRRE